MKRLEISVAADGDLFDILAYGTAVHGAVISGAYYAGLADTFDFLCRNAEAGPVEELTGWAFAAGVIDSIAFSIVWTNMQF